jgi:nitrite reductase/ring-hydroxylating ferredoxin subunit
MKGNNLEWKEIGELDEDDNEGLIFEFLFRSQKHYCFRFQDEIHVIPSKCPHNGAFMGLSGINLKNRTITCPLHKYCFDIITGKLIQGASTCNLEKIPAKIHNGKLYLGVPIPWWKF